MDEFINCYEVLGIAPQASEKEIRQAFRALAKIYHPDVNQSHDAHTRFIAIEQAYTVLSDASQRADFDERLAARRAGETVRPRKPVPKAFSVYIFPNFQQGMPAHFIVRGRVYGLTAAEVRRLERDGMLRGRTESAKEYLLMYCVKCHALFDTAHARDLNNFLYYPYELFSVCPHCKTIDWCPADEVREEKEKQDETVREQETWARLEEFRRQQEAARVREVQARLDEVKRQQEAAQAQAVRFDETLRPRARSQQSGKRKGRLTRPAIIKITVVLLTLFVIGGSLGGWFFYRSIELAQIASQARATATAIARLNPDPSFHTLAYTNNLTFNSGDWNTSTQSSLLQTYGSCDFTCLLQGSFFTNFSSVVQMKILTGDCGGLVFSSEGEVLSYASVCQNGDYGIVYQESNIENLLSLNRILASGYSSSIKQGPDQTNLVAISVHGSTVTLYVNGERITQVTDGAAVSGNIGLVAYKGSGSSSPQAEAAFNNLYIWTS